MLVKCIGGVADWYQDPEDENTSIAAADRNQDTSPSVSSVAGSVEMTSDENNTFRVRCTCTASW